MLSAVTVSLACAQSLNDSGGAVCRDVLISMFAEQTLEALLDACLTRRAVGIFMHSRRGALIENISNSKHEFNSARCKASCQLCQMPDCNMKACAPMQVLQGVQRAVIFAESW